MFKKLLGNLPFNPSLIGQVSFYAKRLHRETSIRRLGFVLISLAFALQIFTIASPPQPTLASSSSDLITGGFSTQAQAVGHCQNNTRNYRQILSYYGISCDALAKATTVNVGPRDYNNSLYIMGRLAYGVSGETPVSIPDAGTLYLRHFWSLMKSPSYKALKGTTVEGKTFYVLYLCGNLVFIGLPKPPERCKFNTSLYANDAKCFEPCPVKGKTSLPKASSDCFEPCPYNKALAANNAKCFEPCPVKGKASIPKASSDCFEPCVYDSTISKESASCKPCEASQTRDDLTACITYVKSASNLTQQLADANGTTAKANDVIQYTLKTSNKGKETIHDYTVNENISDVLDYADLVDAKGGSINADKVISWPKTDIKAGATIERSFTIKIKDPIPSTPASISDPAHYDMVMTNVYGNTVNIKLPPTIIKTAEVVTRTMPNTGPGTALIIGTLCTMFVGYLYARSRLLAKELDIVRADFGSTGGI